MFRRIVRRTAFALVAGALGLLMATIPPQLSPEQAHAAITPYTPPGPINALPSTVIGATRGLSTMEAAAIAVIQYAKTPEGAKAIRAFNAGTATPAQLATVNNIKAGHSVMATKPAHLMKGAAPLMSFAIGLQIGQGITRIAGFNDDAVCVQQNDVLEFVTAITNGVSCDGWKNALEESLRNAEENLGSTTGTEVCTTGGSYQQFCLQWVGSYIYTYSGMPDRNVDVFRITPIGPWSTSANYQFKYNAASPTWSAAVFNPSDNWTDCGAGAGRADYASVCQSLFGEGHRVVMNGAGTASVQTYRARGGPSTYSDAGTITESSANPQRRFKCEIQYSDATTDAFWSDPYTENDVNVAPIQCPPANPSKVVTGTKIIQETDGLPDGLLMEQPTTPEYQQHQALYPECSDGTCLLDLVHVASSQSCFDAPETCAEWFQDPNKASNYSCRYGTHAVDLAECNLYAPTFKPEQVSQGKGYGDPETGATTSTQTTTTADAPAMGQQPSPTEGRQCMPTGWGVLNPIEWVMKPVQCALEWAFVPRPEVIEASFNDMNEKWAETPPMRVAAMVSAWDFDVSVDGCEGVLIPFSQVWEQLPDGHILEACPGDPLEPAAHTSNVVVGIVAVLGAIFAVTRHVGGIVEYGGMGRGDS